jgi:hypothetical protein
LNKENIMNTVKKALVTLIGLTFAAVAASPALAGPHDPRVNARQHHQHDRVKQGVRSGALTRDETKQLAAEQRAIRKEERLYKSDGVLTKDERRDLRQDQNAASKNIYNEKHDAEHR